MKPKSDPNRFSEHGPKPVFQVKADRVEQEGFVAMANSPTEIVSNQNRQKAKWTLRSDISHYPTFKSEQILIDALYNLSLEEVILNTEADQTFRTGEKWEGVWTRDVSYGIMLGLGILEPEMSKNSLRRKVKSGRIVQDTGTGGAYPVSSDRVVWALAAYEIYQVTGDRDWLEEIYPVIKDSVKDDLKNVHDPKTGLVKGESSFLDWREQTYPRWMQPADIFESLALGTNAVHHQANKLLALIAAELEDHAPAQEYARHAAKIKTAINTHLWMEDKGYYGQYLYGRTHKLLSPRAEALGEALCVLFDIADHDKQNQVVAQTPVTPFGIPCIFPQIPGIPPYHNDGVWPFVQAFWSLAAAKVGNEDALTESLDAIYRAAALFLTNKENFVVHSGEHAGTQINSDRQLWSVAGNLGMVFKVFFGLGFEKDYLTFSPSVPKKYTGKKQLQGLKIRNVVLDLEMEGFGRQIQTISLDGQLLDKPQIPLTLEGQHHVKISLTNHSGPLSKINKQEVFFSPDTPKAKLHANTLVWEGQDDAKGYKVLKNGKFYLQTEKSQVAISGKDHAVYQVIAISDREEESYASAPILANAAEGMGVVQLEKFAGPVLSAYSGYRGEGYVEISKTVNKALSFTLSIPQTGDYAMHFVYSNGNGPINTGNSCAIRALYREDVFIGTFVFPHRGMEIWDEWGESNSIQLPLEKGLHHFTLSLEAFCENMNGTINQAMLDCVRVVRLA
ncbi:alpha-L-rhamnosidase-related protein [Pararhodonellum marinum]|uniref:alpha-L-rhamnosidase-related protein n=1 Tax=Pararhodonellum marinum TaxID=2755358 RepID=UPI0018902748|nr:amylo-alpha-1,6-glucosidase [Pararhodonellum marinum]